MLQNSDWFLNDVEKDTLDLAFHSSGIDQCVSENLFGPRIRRYYLIHFVLEGYGVLQIEKQKYPVKPGQAFFDSCRSKRRLPGRFQASVEILLDRIPGNPGWVLYGIDFWERLCDRYLRCHVL